jgi:hypothetical protein
MTRRLTVLSFTFQSMSFNHFTFFYKTSFLNKDVDCTEPYLSVSQLVFPGNGPICVLSLRWPWREGLAKTSAVLLLDGAKNIANVNAP